MAPRQLPVRATSAPRKAAALSVAVTIARCRACSHAAVGRFPRKGEHRSSPAAGGRELHLVISEGSVRMDIVSKDSEGAV